MEGGKVREGEMTYSNWHGRCPGGELSERGDVRAGRCPAGEMSYTRTSRIRRWNGMPLRFILTIRNASQLEDCTAVNWPESLQPPSLARA